MVVRRPVAFAGGSTGLGGPVDPRKPARPSFMPEPTRAGCGCLLLSSLGLILLVVLISGQF